MGKKTEMAYKALDIIGVGAAIITCVAAILVGIFSEKHDLEYYINRLPAERQAKATELRKAFDHGDIKAGTLFLFREGSLVVFVKDKKDDTVEILSPGTRNWIFLFDIVIGTKDFYPPEVDGRAGKERAYLLEQFSQGKKAEEGWKQQVR